MADPSTVLGVSVNTSQEDIDATYQCLSSASTAATTENTHLPRAESQFVVIDEEEENDLTSDNDDEDAESAASSYDSDHSYKPDNCDAVDGSRTGSPPPSAVSSSPISESDPGEDYGHLSTHNRAHRKRISSSDPSLEPFKHISEDNIVAAMVKGMIILPVPHDGQIVNIHLYMEPRQARGQRRPGEDDILPPKGVALDCELTGIVNRSFTLKAAAKRHIYNFPPSNRYPRRTTKFRHGRPGLVRSGGTYEPAEPWAEDEITRRAIARYGSALAFMRSSSMTPHMNRIQKAKDAGDSKREQELIRHFHDNIFSPQWKWEGGTLVDKMPQSAGIALENQLAEAQPGSCQAEIDAEREILEDPEISIKTLKRQHQEELASLSQKHETALALVNASNETLKRQYQEDVARLTQTHELALANFKILAENSLLKAERVQRNVEDKLRGEIQDLRERLHNVEKAHLIEKAHRMEKAHLMETVSNKRSWESTPSRSALMEALEADYDPSSPETPYKRARLG